MSNLILFSSVADENLCKNRFNVLNESTVNKHGYANPYNKPIIETVLQDFVLNRNGRLYDKDHMMAHVNGTMVQEKLMGGNLKGEDEHPVYTTDDTKAIQSRMTTVLGRNVCHKILKIWLTSDNLLMGHVMPSGPLGKYMEEDIREGGIPAFSFRGLGGMDPATNRPRISIAVTWDKVAFPSHKAARMTNVLQESFDGKYDLSVDNVICLESGASEFITKNDPALRAMCESMDLDLIHKNTIVYKNGLTSITDGKTTIKTNLDKNIFNTISNIRL